MKFFHLADLHLGKTLHGFSLVEEGDQPYWVERFLGAVDEYQPDCVLISGDVYDRAVPSGEAVALFDHLVTSLSRRTVPTFVIAGNHDSGPRLSFASRLLEHEHVYLSGEIRPELTHVTLEDAFGPVTFWLMPFLFPAAVRAALDQPELSGYDEAARALLAAQPIDFSQRNVLLAHQFVTGGAPPETDGSETAVGGLGQIDVSAFDGFDYVALGHIHSPQAVGRENVRYAGSPLPYSFSETRRAKTLTLVELREKGEIHLQALELPALHGMRQERGTLAEVLARGEGVSNREDYLRVLLTDVPMPARAMEQLRAVYPNLMEVARDVPHAAGDSADMARNVKERPLEALFWDFFAHQTGEVPDQPQLELVALAAEQARRAQEPSQLEADALALAELALSLYGEEAQDEAP